MTDRVTREDLRNTTPDPTQDFDGFLNAIVEKIMDKHEALSLLPPREKATLLLVEACERMSRGLQQRTPPVVLQVYARSLARSLDRWAKAMEADG